MTDDRDPSVRTVTCFVPLALVVMVVVLMALKRCAYPSPQIAENREGNEPNPDDSESLATPARGTLLRPRERREPDGARRKGR